MSLAQATDVLIYVCHNCTPEGARMPRQWEQQQLHVQVHEVPCSGKIDVQYLFHAFEGGTRGICVFTCPQGECQRAQGNYRAEVRVRTVQRLLTEIGMEADRIALVHSSAQEPADGVERLARAAVERFAALGASPAAVQGASL
jgi:F420-non-reducing hydrogenase iron-sulfur subunit